MSTTVLRPTVLCNTILDEHLAMEFLSPASLTSYTPANPSNIALLALDCPALNNHQYTSHYTDTFTQYCGIDMPAGHPAATGGTYVDLVDVVAYTADACMDACSALSFRSGLVGGNTTKCLAVMFLQDMSDFITGDCFLKNGSLAEGQALFEKQYAFSAVITSG